MDRRRVVKNTDINKYKEISDSINRKIREANETWMLEKCLEIEKLDKVYDARNIYNKVKEICNSRNIYNGILRDKQGRIITTVEERVTRWAEYVGERYDDERKEITDISS